MFERTFNFYTCPKTKFGEVLEKKILFLIDEIKPHSSSFFLSYHLHQNEKTHKSKHKEKKPKHEKQKYEKKYAEKSKFLVLIIISSKLSLVREFIHRKRFNPHFQCGIGVLFLSVHI